MRKLNRMADAVLTAIEAGVDPDEAVKAVGWKMPDRKQLARIDATVKRALQQGFGIIRPIIEESLDEMENAQ